MRRLLFALTLLISISAHARYEPAVFQKGFVQIRGDRRLYVEQRKAAPGKPTIVFCNGLTWSTAQWQPLVNALDKIDPQIGIVLYDMVGMGKTLLDRKPVTYDIPFNDQIRDLKDLVTKLDIKGEKILGGLSYGGAASLEYLALFPNDFSKVIAQSPFLYRLPDQDRWIQNNIAIVRATLPMNPATDEELYDFFLRQLVYTTYPAAEPIMLENPYKTEGVFRMVKGAKNWRAGDGVSKYPAGKLHLMSGANDAFVTLPMQQNFWQSVPEQARGSFLILRDTDHKIPQQRPDITAVWMMNIVHNNPEIQHGRVFDGDPARGEARSGSVIISLKKESICEDILRKSLEPK